MSFQYTGRAGKAAIVSLRLCKHYKDTEQHIREFLRGTTMVITPEAYEELFKLGMLNIEYCTTVIYSDTASINLLLNKQLVNGMYKDHMPDKARANYLRYELLIASNPLEAIAFASDNAITFGKIHTTNYLQFHLDNVLGQDNWDSAVVFINVFEEKPGFVDLELNYEI